MIPTELLKALSKVDWNKVGKTAKKVGEAAVVVIGVVAGTKKLKGNPSVNKQIEKELKKLEKMLRKGIITKQEYEERRSKILNS